MLRSLIRPVLRIVALRLFRVRVSYAPASVELLRQGHVIVCANHVSLLDGVLVALASPVPLTFGVDTDFSRGATFASRGLAALAWLGYGAVVPIDACAPHGIRSLAKVLDRGASVMVFPEGRISENGQQLPDQPGLAWLARRSGAQILRIRIQGAERSRFFAKAGAEWWPRIELHF